MIVIKMNPLDIVNIEQSKHKQNTQRRYSNKHKTQLKYVSQNKVSKDKSNKERTQ